MEKKFYVAPAIELEQIAVEKGFAQSGGNMPDAEDGLEW